jgi:hypothetical protein
LVPLLYPVVNGVVPRFLRSRRLALLVLQLLMMVVVLLLLLLLLLLGDVE